MPNYLGYVYLSRSNEKNLSQGKFFIRRFFIILEISEDRKKSRSRFEEIGSVQFTRLALFLVRTSSIKLVSWSDIL